MKKRRLKGHGWRLDWIPEPEKLQENYDESVVYYIACVPVKTGYIGSCVLLHDRLKKHFGDLALGQHPNQTMQSDWNEYGIKAFTWGILEICLPESLKEREQYWIDHYDNSKLYNRDKIAKRKQGPHWNDYHKKRRDEK